MRTNINTINLGARFRAILPYKNFLTPTIIIYRYRCDYLIELSYGEDIGGAGMFGVTVVDCKKQEHRRDLCGLFKTRKEANTHINKLA